ncbi:MAG TPA: endonuclease MutS2, partial [Dehalococcoidia bacterium]|nr:endonuclease MutS2 [Dehalococcoidia bacterium]
MTQAAERTEGIAEKTLRTLEYDKVLERLAAHTSFSLGRALALASRPTTVHAEVVRLQRMTAEARHLATQRGFSLGGAKDVRSLVEKAALGGVLDPGELLDIRGTLEAAAAVQSFVQRTAGMTPLLTDLVDEIEPLPSIVTEIARSIDERAEVMDAASPALGALRREVRSLHDTLVARVESIMRDSFDRGVAQEPIVTQRDGRYVIPVKADARGQLPGVVHDVSASGATVFVEPLAVIELANRWREAQLEERREVERVLRRLSADVGSETSAIVRNIEILGELDVAIARARYAEELHAPLPSLNDGPVWVVEAPAELRLLEARHPLLSGHVVPVTILVGSEDARILLITGPNTGGKTVALKTAGLLVLMAQSGMGVPAEEGSQLPVYESVLADIGDEQSIEQSLSTFSGHISNIVQILAQAGPPSLVLLDELAAGTDPAEGAPLARAILTELLERRATVLATTHHGELKTFAH